LFVDGDPNVEYIVWVDVLGGGEASLVELNPSTQRWVAWLSILV